MPFRYPELQSRTSVVRSVHRTEEVSTLSIDTITAELADDRFVSTVLQPWAHA